MQRVSFLALSLALLTSFSAHAAIFGADDRLSITPNLPVADLARSVAVAILSSNEQPDEGRKTFSLDTQPLSNLVCSTERFYQDQSLAYSCTGFLVGPDLLVTAGHCAVNVGESRHETDTFCQAFSWMFDYRPNTFGITRTKQIDYGKLYRCKETIYAVKEEVAPYRDFAIIRLDRPVVDRVPLKMSDAGVSTSDTFSMIGFPLGTPAKLSRNAKLLRNDLSRTSFVTNLDAFEGNSGSPVFNQKWDVVGILISGTPEAALIPNANNTCKRYNRCDNDGKNCTVSDTDTKAFPEFQQTGSDVQRIEPVIEFVKTLNALPPTP